MSSKELQGQERQFAQSLPEKRESVTLDKRYKSIGISAVSAAASMKPRKPKKPVADQMS